MRPLAKFVIILLAITVISVYYVKQQTVLLSLSYEIQQDHQMIEKLSDKNNFLLFESIALKSPRNIECRLAASEIDMAVPEKNQVIYLADARENEEETVYIGQRILEVFSLFTKAEALQR